MQIAFIVDPLATLQAHHDTSVAMMQALQSRGHTVYGLELADLWVQDGEAHGRLQQLDLSPHQGSWYRVIQTTAVALSQMDVVWMRKDPPVDTAYLYATHILDLIDPAGTLVLNHPAGLRSANEKVYALQFSAWTPRTVVSSQAAILKAFIEKEQKAVLKPLGGKGGEGILICNHGDPNINSLIEISTQSGRIPVMVQEYLPQAKEGDKRILLLEGEPIGAVNRVPGQGDFRGNIAAGGSVQKTVITDREKAMCADLAPVLKAAQLYFVGIDVIGEKLTEINVTSPTMIQEISQLAGIPLADHVAEWLETKVAALPSHRPS
jgi:glutathione synthase